MEKMYQILKEEKPNQREQIRIRADTLNRYFPKGFTPRQKVELIEALVKEWHENQIIRKPKSHSMKSQAFLQKG